MFTQVAMGTLATLGASVLSVVDVKGNNGVASMQALCPVLAPSTPTCVCRRYSQVTRTILTRVKAHTGDS